MFGREAHSNKWALAGVVPVLALYCWEWYAYVFLAKSPIAWSVVFHIVFGLSIWSYLQTLWTDPGTPQCSEWRVWRDARQASGESAPQMAKDDPDRRTWKPGQTTWCAECCAERPERAHHCSELGVCVLRMDHYCLWVGNCVGWRNHKFFILMNWWSFWACTVWLATIQEPGAPQAVDSFMNSGGHAGVAIGAFLAMIFWTVTGGMFLYAMSQAAKNLSTVEEMLPGSNPYQLGTAENLKQLMGPVSWRLPLPIAPVDPDRPSGCHFQLRTSGAGQKGYGSV